MNPTEHPSYLTTSPQQATSGTERYRTWKLILFFLIGTSGVIGSAFAGAWIMFRAKQNRRNKYIAVGIGLLLSTAGVMLFQQFVFVQSPVTHDVYHAVHKQFPSGRTHVGTGWNKTWSDGTAHTSRGLTVQHLSRNLISADEMHRMATVACDQLQGTGVHYDVVAIENHSSIAYPFSIPLLTIRFRGNASCEDWRNKETLQHLRHIRSLLGS